MRLTGDGRRSTVAAAFAIALLLPPMWAEPARAVSGGGTIWTARFNGPVNLDDGTSSLAVGPGGTRIFVTGYTTSGPAPPEPYDSDFLTVAYRGSSGGRLWVARYNGPAKSDDVAAAAVAGPKGAKVFVTGTSDGARYANFATVAYASATGQRLWVSRYGGSGFEYDRPAAIAVSPDGSTVFVTGSSETSEDSAYVTVAYAASTGSQRWAARYAGPGDGGDSSRSLAVSPDGSTVFVTGLSAGTTSDYATVAYDTSTGSQRWVARYDGPAGGADGATFLFVNPRGSAVYVTGESAAENGLFDYATVAYAPSTGKQLWVARYDGPGHRDDISSHLAMTPNGAWLFVTGASVGRTGGFDYATIAYRASTGGRRWVARYRGPVNGDDLATSVAVNPDGSTVYVTGSAVYGTPTSRTIDYGTIAYEVATGVRLWLARYDGRAGGADHANALGVSPDGSRVYVTGQSVGTSTHPWDLLPLDAATVAYRG